MSNEGTTERDETGKQLQRDFQNYVKSRNTPKSKENDFWTPRDVFDSLNERFGPFTLDAAASKENALLPEYFDIEANSLEQEWKGKVWCNPPYNKQGKTSIKDWVHKAYDSVNSGLAQVVLLLIPIYTICNYYWHEKVFPYASHLVFFRGRLDFGGPHRREGGASRHGSVGIVFQNAWKGTGMQVLTMSTKGEWLTKEIWDRELLELKLKNGIFAQGEYLDENRFLVKAGSTANLKPRKSWRSSSIKARNSLIEEGTLVSKDGTLVFTRDVTFSSPSKAAECVRATPSNGRKLWRAVA